MNRKSQGSKTLEREQQMQSADIMEQQAKNQALIQATEAADVAGYTEQRDSINQLLGRVEMANAISKFANVVSLSQLQHIKENKLYRALKGVRRIDADGNEIADVGTWDGFCRAIGTTKSKVDEDLINLRTFGEDALENLNRIGAGYRELRKLRTLPEEDRELIINGETVKAGDHESLVDLIEELASKHAKERESFAQRETEISQQLDAERRLVDSKNKKIDELTRDAEKHAAMPEQEKAQRFAAELQQESQRVKASLLGPERVIGEIQDWCDAPQSLRNECALTVKSILDAVDDLRDRLQLEYIELESDALRIDAIDAKSTAGQA